MIKKIRRRRGGARWQPRVVTLGDPAIDLDSLDITEYVTTLDEDILPIVEGETPTWWHIRGLTTPELRQAEHVANARTDFSAGGVHATKAVLLKEAAFELGVVSVENWVESGDRIEGLPADIFADIDPDDPKSSRDIDPFFLDVAREIGGYILRLSRGEVGRQGEGEPDPKR